MAFVANLTGLWEPAFTGVLILLGIEIRVKGAYQSQTKRGGSELRLFLSIKNNQILFQFIFNIPWISLSSGRSKIAKHNNPAS